MLPLLFCSYGGTQPPGGIARSPLEMGFFRRPNLTPGICTSGSNMKSVIPHPWFVREDWVGRAEGGGYYLAKVLEDSICN